MKNLLWILVLVVVLSACGNPQSADKESMMSDVKIYLSTYEVEGEIDDDIAKISIANIERINEGYTGDDKDDFGRIAQLMKMRAYDEVKEIYDRLKTKK
ncbi:hypothetical protein J41TS12_39530 [Paenibacillus antibioticophila]|uniref:Uncharacterized protein n=1 Tax=Paenibacillus antibioticophila TaxID=1274374 RepID=A0A919XTX9_9BACL|nr:hypothetical protein [Paenibacillus antibioticophila]GIO39092.1 hypothetical protein J41TS12_39530 [Paenibacillus antibioticophila]